MTRLLRACLPVLEIARAAERDSHEWLVDCRDKQYCQDDMPGLTYGQWLEFLAAFESAQRRQRAKAPPDADADEVALADKIAGHFAPHISNRGPLVQMLREFLEPLRERLRLAESQRDKLLVAARGHDKCWQTDCDLYRAAGLEPGDAQLPPRDEFRRACVAYEASQYGDAQPTVDASIDASAPWAEMLAQAETIFRNVLETSPVLAELRARLDALQSATARVMAIEREPSGPVITS